MTAEKQDRRWSLQARLAWRLGFVLLGSMLLVALVISQYAWFALDDLDDVGLQVQASQIAKHTQVRDGALTVELPPSLQQAYHESGDGYMYAVLDPQGQIIAASSEKARRSFSGLSLGSGVPARTVFRLLDADGQESSYYAMLDTAGLPAGYILVAQGRIHPDVFIDTLLSEFAKRIGWTLPLVLAAALFIAIWTIRTSLRPIKELSLRARQIGPQTRNLRLPTEGVAEEILPLPLAINSALDRLEQGFEMQRRFTANAAHELRTPLAVLTARLAELQDGPDIRLLAGDIGRMNRLVAQLLQVSRLEGALLKFETLDLNPAAETVVAFLAPLAIGAGKSVALTASSKPVLVEASADALENALRNLVENAIAHTAPGTEVMVLVSPDGSIAVRDHGPGVPVEQREQIFERFWRGRNRQHPGAGLGLAIVAETMRGHGGRVTVGDAPGGGAEFVLHFPLHSLRQD
ncbi:ATP-binding protein [Ferrovibrio sp.]|uniref:ATP-binding protein n=1 Tax=Ferrovibrio sp. TaxID=1917215 RepID=UPI00261F901C|nr:ATP-binding protein [Ferrovibrio sp.]